MLRKKKDVSYVAPDPGVDDPQPDDEVKRPKETQFTAIVEFYREHTIDSASKHTEGELFTCILDMTHDSILAAEES